MNSLLNLNFDLKMDLVIAKVRFSYSPFSTLLLSPYHSSKSNGWSYSCLLNDTLGAMPFFCNVHKAVTKNHLSLTESDSQCSFSLFVTFLMFSNSIHNVYTRLHLNELRIFLDFGLFRLHLWSFFIFCSWFHWPPPSSQSYIPLTLQLSDFGQ